MANINVEVLISAKDQASAVLKKFQNTAESAGERLAQTFKTGGLAAIGFLGALGAVGKAAVDVSADFEQSKIAFETMLGSVELAGKTLTDLSNFARTTPFEFPELVDASKRLLAYGTTAEDLIPTLTNLGNITAGVGRDKLPQLILAFGQVKAATVLTGAELRQFSEAGVPLLETLAKQAGMSAREMKDAIADSAVTFEDVDKALKSLSGEGGKFFNLMAKQSKSFGGVMSNIKDQITRSLLEIAGISVDQGGVIREGSLFAVLKDGAEAFLEALQVVTPKLIEFTNWVANNQTALAAIAGAIGGLLILAIGFLIVTFGTAIAIMVAFMAVGAAVGVAVQQLAAHWNEITTSVTNAWEAVKTFFVDTVPTAVGNAITSIIGWFAQLPNAIFQYWVKLMTQDIPYAWGFLAGYLYDAVPKLINAIIGWFMLLPPRVMQVWLQFKADAMMKVAETAAWLQGEISTWPGRIYGFIASIPSIVADVFEKAKKWVVDIMESMFNGVSDWWGKIKAIFDAIIGAANSAIDAIKRGFEAGRQASGGRQAGGIVPGARDEPRMILAHGGEEVVPVDKRGSGGEGGGLSLTVNVGIYAGSEIEKRNVARELYASLVQLAQAENKTVAEMMGR